MFDEASKVRIKEFIGEVSGFVGDFVDSVPIADGVREVRYENLQRGYCGWFWAAAVTEDLSVLEVYPLPGPKALLLPVRPVRSRQIIVEEPLLTTSVESGSAYSGLDVVEAASDEIEYVDEGTAEDNTEDTVAEDTIDTIEYFAGDSAGDVDEEDILLQFDRDGVDFEEEN